MPKLYNIYLVNSCPFWLKVEAQMLWACESEKEAEEYAQKEWSEDIEEGIGYMRSHDMRDFRGDTRFFKCEIENASSVTINSDL